MVLKLEDDCNNVVNRIPEKGTFHWQDSCISKVRSFKI